MFNRSEIMKAAWVRCRYVRRSYGQWQFDRGIIDGTFANALRIEWRVAKEAARNAAVMAGPNASRIEAIRDQIDALKYKSFQINVEPRRRALEAELIALKA